MNDPKIKVCEGHCPECGGELDNLQDVTEDSGNKFFRMGCPKCKKVFWEQYVESFFGFAVFDKEDNYTGETKYTPEPDPLCTNLQELLDKAQEVVGFLQYRFDTPNGPYTNVDVDALIELQDAIAKATRKPE